MKTNLKSLVIGVTLISAGLPAQANLIEEIVVTAQKRQESVQDVPISVTVMSADEITRQGFQTIQDLSRASASLEFTDSSVGPGGGGFVRGIGFLGLGAETAQSSVSIVLDGVVLGNVPVTDMFDVERVEILKGPQGTLFGTSVSSGVVSITSKAPDPTETSFYLTGEFALEGTGSEYDRSVIRAAANFPLSQDSAIRIAAHTYSDEGFTENVYTGNDSTKDNYGFRIRYLNNLSDDLTLNLIADYNKSDEDNTTQLMYYYAPPGSVLESALTECGVTASEDNTDVCHSQTKQREREIRGISAQFDWNVNDHTFTSITSYRESEQQAMGDIIGIPQDVLANWFTFPNGCNPSDIPCNTIRRLTPGYPGNPQENEQDLFTQEFRLASPVDEPVEWVIGAFYQDYNFKQESASYLSIGVPTPRPCIFIGDGIVEGDGLCRINAGEEVDDSYLEEYAAFANVTFNVSDLTRIIVGARYTDSEVSITQLESPGGAQIDSYTADASEFTWRLGAQHDLSDSSMMYATISTGYKSPQVNTQTPGNWFDVKPETPISYELGIKTTLLDGRLAVNADVFLMDVEDYQGQVCVADALGGGIDCQSVNVKEVESKGIELDLFGRVTDHTSINLSGIYNIVEYPKGQLDQYGNDLSGKQLAYAPKYKVTLSGEHEIPLNDQFVLALGADVTARDEQRMYFIADDVYVKDATVIYNARVSLKSADDWSVSLFGRNLGDEVYPSNIFPTIAFHNIGAWQSLNPHSRRLMGLQFEVNF